ncbi:unnamed protein product [Fusarium venenatum]|uniref:Uncharacterized protein n=1 Tax=Fusarium venenatum TaxID=56646 RepID=A0A2L2TH10_9HYPO|nr:uncharacterized protein FVRRES_13533 [Fusarium venenatum]CEI41339.1 unnamed protein product [Fusarium venenatum]
MALPVSDEIFLYKPRKGCEPPNQESCDTSSHATIPGYSALEHAYPYPPPGAETMEGKAKAAAMMSMLDDKQSHVPSQWKKHVLPTHDDLSYGL